MQNNASNLGVALTSLGLEDKFLSNGELSNYPLAERGEITNGIIEEKLKSGRWPRVIDMVYGGFGKADALYDGDKEKLRESILSSARSHPDPETSINESLSSLTKFGENELLFELVSDVLTLRLDEYTSIASKIDKDFWEDSEKGSERKRKFNETALSKAMNEGEYYPAYGFLKELGDEERIDNLFDLLLTKSVYSSYNTKSLLELIYKSNPGKRHDRIKKLY